MFNDFALCNGLVTVLNCDDILEKHDSKFCPLRKKCMRYLEERTVIGSYVMASYDFDAKDCVNFIKKEEQK